MQQGVVEPFSHFPAEVCRSIQFILTDIDDTLTFEGRLAARTYDALERLHKAGLAIIPVTAAPAGWCDQIARMWPINGIIGENGGLYFVFDHEAKTMRRRFWLDEAARSEAMQRLGEVAATITSQVSGAGIAADQRYRETTLAIEFSTPETRARGSNQVAHRLRDAGARATINSLWVIGWFGDFDKLAMARATASEIFGHDLSAMCDSTIYVGDSLNDEPMFDFFPHSVGVSTVRVFLSRMRSPPRWITRGPGGMGFVEVADALLQHRSRAPHAV